MPRDIKNDRMTAEQLQALVLPIIRREIRKLSSALSLDDLSDVSITSPVIPQVIRYTGSGWVNSQFRRKVEPAALTASVDDYAPAEGNFYLIDTDEMSVYAITGWATGAGLDASEILVVNVSGLDILLQHEDLASSAANRLYTPTGTTAILSPDQTAKFIYDTTLSRWRVTLLGGSGDAIDINGVDATNVTLQDNTPSPPADGANVKWQTFAGDPTVVSGYIDVDDLVIPFAFMSPPLIDFLSPMFQTGDMLTHNGTTHVRLDLGTPGQQLRVNAGGTLPEWFTPSAGSVDVKQTEIDFGSTPVAEAEFTVVDAGVSPTSQLLAWVAYEAPTGKDLDELEMDALDVKVGPGSGQFTLRVKGLEGYVAGTFKINYLIG